MGIRPGRPYLSAGASWALPRSPIRCLDVSYTPRGAKRGGGKATFHIASVGVISFGIYIGQLHNYRYLVLSLMRRFYLPFVTVFMIFDEVLRYTED